jgi:hypothetical protein
VGDTASVCFGCNSVNYWIGYFKGPGFSQDVHGSAIDLEAKHHLRHPPVPEGNYLTHETNPLTYSDTFMEDNAIGFAEKLQKMRNSLLDRLIRTNSA